MKETEIASILNSCDESIGPDKALEKLTAARMNTVPARRSRRLTTRTFLIAAAAALCLTMMISAGYKVFEYIYFRPGTGIVLDDGSIVISTLEHATQYDGSIYVEACSLEKNGDATNKLTLITNNLSSVPGKGALGEAVTAECDGEIYILELDNNSSGISYYVCNDFPYINSFRVGNAEITLTPIDAAQFAVVKYPVSHGITVIAFPLSEGSSMLAYTVRYEPEDDGTVLPELEELSESVSADLWHPYQAPDYKVTVTDILGGTYQLTGTTGSWSGPKSDSEGYLNGQHIISLDRRLEADVASISIDTISVEFYRPKLMETVTVTVPALGETLDYSEPFINKLGFYDSPDSLSFFRSETNTLLLHFNKPTTCDIDYVSRTQPIYALYTADELESDLYGKQLFAGLGISIGSTSDKATGLLERNYTKSAKSDSNSFTTGDSISVELYSLIIEITGNWTIDYN